jgi:hypothetical protein
MSVIKWPGLVEYGGNQPGLFNCVIGCTPKRCDPAALDMARGPFDENRTEDGVLAMSHRETSLSHPG